MPVGAIDSNVFVAVLVLVLIALSFLVFAGVSGALGRWRERLRGLDEELLAAEGKGRATAVQEPDLRDEVRELVLAANERRQRRGQPPLDVEAEVERRLRELEDRGP